MHVKPSAKKKYKMKATKFFGKILMKKLEKKKTEAKALKDGSTGVYSIQYTVYNIQYTIYSMQ